MDSPSKYVFEHVRYDEDLVKQFLCDVCRNPFLDAEVAIPCGHSFCGFCVEQFKGSINAGNAAACSLCKDPITAFNKNRLANSLLQTVQAECVWCGTKVKLDDAKRHIRQCDLIEIPCEKCRKAVKKCDLGQHKNEECEQREIVCACGKHIKKHEEEEHMAKVCSFKKEQCPLNCGENIERYLIPAHSTTCGQVAKRCEVKGCGQVMQRRDEKKHIAENMQRHFNLLQREQKAIMWQVEASQIGVVARRGGPKAVIKWSIPDDANQHQELCSPLFNKLSKKWRIHLKKQEVLLEYSQGVDEIVAFIRFIVELENGEEHVFLDNFRVVIKEGECVAFLLSSRPVKAIVMVLEVAEPEKYKFASV